MVRSREVSSTHSGEEPADRRPSQENRRRENMTSAGTGLILSREEEKSILDKHYQTPAVLFYQSHKFSIYLCSFYRKIVIIVYVTLDYVTKTN